ncbi:MAG TPA: DUF2267 domain-containing protein [Actinomycetota bacterium]|jgi:uncharacterized protein (DUF2267 family)
MDYADFLSRVEEQSGLDTDDADQAVVATLSTLAERISEEEAADLAAQLPGELKPQFDGASADAEIFDAREFLRRVAERASTSTDKARESAEAVLTALREAISGGELEDILLQLPDDYLELFA